MKTIRHKFIVNTGGSTAEVESTTGAPGLIRMVETQPLRMAAEPGARVDRGSRRRRRRGAVDLAARGN